MPPTARPGMMCRSNPRPLRRTRGGHDADLDPGASAGANDHWHRRRLRLGVVSAVRLADADLGILVPADRPAVPGRGDRLQGDEAAGDEIPPAPGADDY